MDSCERAIMGLESPAVSALVTKHFVTIFSKTCNKKLYFIFNLHIFFCNALSLSRPITICPENIVCFLRLLHIFKYTSD